MFCGRNEKRKKDISLCEISLTSVRYVRYIFNHLKLKTTPLKNVFPHLSVKSRIHKVTKVNVSTHRISIKYGKRSCFALLSLQIVQFCVLLYVSAWIKTRLIASFVHKFILWTKYCWQFWGTNGKVDLKVLSKLDLSPILKKTLCLVSS